MITLFHRKQSRSDRVLWLLEELKIPYELNMVERGVGSTDEYRKINPIGRVPAIIDGSLTLFDSGAILEYLLEKYDATDQFKPPQGSEQWSAYIQWMHGAETFMVPGSQFAYHTVIRPEPDRVPALAAEAKADLNKNLEYLDALLADRQYLAGDQFTAADIMLGWGLILMSNFGFGEGFDNVQRYKSDLASRPAWRIVSG
jgi:glutathione S-transferase